MVEVSSSIIVDILYVRKVLAEKIGRFAINEDREDCEERSFLKQILQNLQIGDRFAKSWTRSSTSINT